MPVRYCPDSLTQYVCHRATKPLRTQRKYARDRCRAPFPPHEHWEWVPGMAYCKPSPTQSGCLLPARAQAVERLPCAVRRSSLRMAGQSLWPAAKVDLEFSSDVLLFLFVDYQALDIDTHNL